jgi:hypothetical protein
LVNAVSGAGARGVWQFMPETAKERGMEVNILLMNATIWKNQHKEPVAICYVPKKNLELGLAAASYNGMVNKQMDIQKESNYYDLLLPKRRPVTCFEFWR